MIASLAIGQNVGPFLHAVANIFFYGFTWDDPVNEEIPNNTQANFKGFPGTDGLRPPPKDAKENLLLNF